MKKGEQRLELIPAECTELKPLLIGNDAMRTENGDLPSIPKENAVHCLRKGKPLTKKNGKIKSNENEEEANKGVLPNFWTTANRMFGGKSPIVLQTRG